MGCSSSRRPHVSVVLASIVGSFVVHLACGGGPIATGMAQISAPSTSVAPSSSGSSTSTITASSSAPATSSECGCATTERGKTVASFVLGGDEKIALDPIDASADLEVTYLRGPTGKKLAAVTAIVRAYRTDQPSERQTTLAIRALVAESGGSPAAKDVEGYVTTWGASTTVPPHAYATIGKSALTYTITDGVLEVKGSLTLKDVPTGRSITIDKLSMRKTGASLLPIRTGALSVTGK